MKAELDWEPSVPLEAGLERVYEWAETELEGTRQAAVADGGDA
jgi:UDP-glucose 4-epimerase